MKKKLHILFLFSFVLLVSSPAYAQTINTVVGTSDLPGYSGDGYLATFAQLDDPSDLAMDTLGNLYIADFYNNVIRIVDTAGNIGTFAGTGFGNGIADAGAFSGDGGPATGAELNGPYALALDGRGNVYFADGYNHVVRVVNAAGIINTFAGTDTAGYRGDGGPATAALLDNPVAIAIDHIGNVYIADDHNHVVRKVSTTGIISTYAGNDTLGYRGDGGPATAAELSLPIGLALDASGNLYISDEDNNDIRMVSPSGIISTFVASDTTHGYSGDGGPATAASLSYPGHLTVGNSNLYISDVYNNVIRIVDLTSGIINTFAGSFYGVDDTVVDCYFGGDGGPATAASLCSPDGIAVGKGDSIYIADRGNAVIRLVSAIYYAGVKPLAKGGMPVLKAYPNPATSGTFTVNLSTNTTETVWFTVTNTLGETVKEIQTTTNTAVGLNLDVPSGMYFISATTGQGNWNKQILIER